MSDRVQKAMEAFVTERDWEKYHSIKNLLLSIQCELGELSECFLWTNEQDEKELLNDPEISQAIQDEISDVYLGLAALCNKLNISLEQAGLAKIEKTAKRYSLKKTKELSPVKLIKEKIK